MRPVSELWRHLENEGCLCQPCTERSEGELMAMLIAPMGVMGGGKTMTTKVQPGVIG